MLGYMGGAPLGYVARVIAISVVLTGYYRLFLRNRPFHRWNRAYLLVTVLFAALMPLVPLPGLFGWTGEAPVLQSVLHAVVPGNWKEGPGSGAGMPVAAGAVDWGWWIGWGYLLIALLLGGIFLWELGFIARLYRRYPRRREGRVLFLLTREPGTPFSFWNTIFWNEEVDAGSAEGRQMLRHELVHVRRWHTMDLLLLRVLLILFWFHPVFYWVYRELRTIHEFEADAVATEGSNRYAYAELLVWQTLAARPGGLFHSFFSSSIKRRVTMITETSFVTPGRWSRWMAAPLAGLLLCAFSGRMALGARAARPITVVIDAGHGGSDDGAVASNGLKEKNINLSLARKVRQLALEYGVHVVLTRDADVLSGGMKSREASLHYRADLAAAKKADLFISLHTDAGSGANQPGFHVYVSKENSHFQQSARLGGLLVDALKPNYTVGEELQENSGHVWVLRAATVPAVLILCGNIDDERDRAFISDAANQEKVARDILDAIVRYQK